MSKRIPGALISARYSTDNQNPDSIEVQVTKCADWCHKNSVTVLGVYADEATSGMKDTRPRYEEMMRQLRAGVGNMVVIYDQSRMFRKMTAWFAFRDELEAMGVQVVSVTQPTVGGDLRDPTNFMMEGSMALFNQIWALQSRQKTMEKLRFMARNGQHTGGIPPLGYKNVDGRLQICEEEAVVVRRIFREYASGKSYRDIIAGLNLDGIRTKRGNAFGSNSLHDLLHNEKYIGILTYGGKPYDDSGHRNTHAATAETAIRIEDAIPAIIDKDLFEQVQARMAQNKRQQGGRPSKNREYPLRSKVFCASCKSAMTISTSQQKYNYYRCTGKKRLHQCDAAPISADVLEQKVIEAVRMILGSPEDVNGLIRILRDQAEQLQTGAVARLQNLIERDREITRQLDNAVTAVLNGMNSPALQKRVAELEAQQIQIAHDMKQLKASVDASAIPEARLRELLHQITTSDNDAAILLSVVARVEVSPDTITVWTILDSDPNGKLDTTLDGVTITPGDPSGVPIVIVTSDFIRISVAR